MMGVDHDVDVRGRVAALRGEGLFGPVLVAIQNLPQGILHDRSEGAALLRGKPTRGREDVVDVHGGSHAP